MNLGICSGILHLTIQETEEVLCAALQELTFLDACSSTRCETIPSRSDTSLVHYLPHHYASRMH